MIQFDWLAREQIERHSLDMRQFIDFRQSWLANGMRLIEAYNGSGLSFTILPDRGLDIWTAHYNGVPLTWVAQGSPFAPDFGQPWLRQFNGGLLTTCGLTHAGPPETDPRTGEVRDLHGRYTRLRATGIAATGAWVNSGYLMELSGTVAESALFGEQLRLDRTYRMALGEPSIEITDSVTNVGDMPAPLMVLYHVNLGYPLISQDTTFDSAYHGVYPRDAEARKGTHRWADYDAAIPGYAEQVYFHHVKADPNGQSAAALLQKSFGLLYTWDTSTLPYITQWKNVRQGIYVCGVEPGNCLPEGQNAARESGRLVMLEPGAEQRFSLKLTVLDGAEAVEAARGRIADLRATGTPLAHCNLHGYID